MGDEDVEHPFAAFAEPGSEKAPPSTLGGGARAYQQLRPGSSLDQGWLVNRVKILLFPIHMDAESPVGLAQYWWRGSHPEQDGLSAVPSRELPDPACASRLEAAVPVTGPVPGCEPRQAAIVTGKTAASWASTCLEKFLAGDHPAPPQLLAAQTLPSTIRDVVDTGRDRS